MQSQPPPPSPAHLSTPYWPCLKQVVLSIDCLAVHPELPLCASGQAAGRSDRELDGTHVQVTKIYSKNFFNTETEFLDISVTKDSILLPHAMPHSLLLADFKKNQSLLCIVFNSPSQNYVKQEN
jgi:hypothetical protein